MTKDATDPNAPPITLLPTQKFVADLTARQIKFDARAIDKGKDWVMVRFTGKHYASITVQFFFDSDGTSVAVKCFCICKVLPGTHARMLEAVNALNVKFRWLSFYIDADGDVCCGADSVLNDNTAAAVCFNLLVRFVTIVDEAYPTLMAAFSPGSIVH